MFKVIEGDAYEKLPTLETDSVDVVFTSPSPPFSEDRGIGACSTNVAYVLKLANIFERAKLVLKNTGSLWVQMGDYHGQDGSLLLTPELFVLKMRERGWIVRSKLIWVREGETYQEDPSRFIRNWEYLYWFVKDLQYYYNKGMLVPYDCFKSGVWSFAPEEVKPGQFKSIFPEGLVQVALSATCPKGGIVLDPFSDSGVTGLVALQNGYQYIGIELSAEKVKRQIARLTDTAQRGAHR